MHTLDYMKSILKQLSDFKESDRYAYDYLINKMKTFTFTEVSVDDVEVGDIIINETKNTFMVCDDIEGDNHTFVYYCLNFIGENRLVSTTIRNGRNICKIYKVESSCWRELGLDISDAKENYLNDKKKREEEEAEQARLNTPMTITVGMWESLQKQISDLKSEIDDVRVHAEYKTFDDEW